MQIEKNFGKGKVFTKDRWVQLVVQFSIFKKGWVHVANFKKGGAGHCDLNN